MTGVLSKLFSFTSARPDDVALAFDGLNPLLAKQLSELETQIGQLAQIQYEMNEERRRMRNEMDALRTAMLRANETPEEKVEGKGI